MRERLIVAGAGLVLLFILADVISQQVSTGESGDVEQQIRQAQNDLEWMQQAAARLPTQKSQNKRPVTGSLVNFINQLVTRLGL